VTPLHVRYILRSHLTMVVADAAIEVLQAAGATGSTTLAEAAAQLGDDHPAVVWLHTLGSGLAYRDAIAEREGWPSEEEDEREVLGRMRPSGTA
jgi:hypothetical protein